MNLLRPRGEHHTLLYYTLTLVLLTSLGLTHSQRKVSRNAGVTLDVKQPLDFDCPEEFGYYPHPNDCTQYYVCVFGGALLESCTGGLMYSHELQTCDWPRNVGCDSSTGSASALSRAESPKQTLSSPTASVRSSGIRYTPPSPIAVTVSSRGQPRQLQHQQLDEDYKISKQRERQQQLYVEAESDLPAAEEIESDGQQRVYRGQPSTVGQVQRDRDALSHTNAIPISNVRTTKIGVISFGTQRQPQQTHVESRQETPQPQISQPQFSKLNSITEDVTKTTHSKTKRRTKRQLRYSRLQNTNGQNVNSGVRYTWTAGTQIGSKPKSNNRPDYYQLSDSRKNLASSDNPSSVFRPSVPEKAYSSSSFDSNSESDQFKPFIPNVSKLPVHILPLLHQSFTNPPSNGSFSYFNLNPSKVPSEVITPPVGDSSYAYYNIGGTASGSSYYTEDSRPMTEKIIETISNNYNRYTSGRPEPPTKFSGPDNESGVPTFHAYKNAPSHSGKEKNPNYESIEFKPIYQHSNFDGRNQSNRYVNNGQIFQSEGFFPRFVGTFGKPDAESSKNPNPFQSNFLPRPQLVFENYKNDDSQEENKYFYNQDDTDGRVYSDEIFTDSNEKLNQDPIQNEEFVQLHAFEKIRPEATRVTKTPNVVITKAIDIQTPRPFKPTLNTTPNLALTSSTTPKHFTLPTTAKTSLVQITTELPPITFESFNIFSTRPPVYYETEPTISSSVTTPKTMTYSKVPITIPKLYSNSSIKIKRPENKRTTPRPTRKILTSSRHIANMSSDNHMKDNRLIDEHSNRIEANSPSTTHYETSRPIRPIGSPQSGNTQVYNRTQYEQNQYDPYYALYDDDVEVEIYRDVDYGQNFNTATVNENQSKGQQQVYRAPVSPSSEQPIETVTVSSRNPSTYYQPETVQYNISPQQNLYKPSTIIEEYSDDNDQNSYSQSVRQPSRIKTKTSDTNSNDFHSTKMTTLTVFKTSTPTRITSTTPHSTRFNSTGPTNGTRPESIFITLSTKPRTPPKPEAPVIPDTQAKFLPNAQNQSRLISLSAGFTLLDADKTRSNTDPETNRASFPHNATIMKPVPFSKAKDSTNTNSDTHRPFTITNLPTSDSKSITINLSSAALGAPSGTKSQKHSDTIISHNTYRPTESSLKRELVTEPSVINQANITSYIRPTTYSVPKHFLEAIFNKTRNLFEPFISTTTNSPTTTTSQKPNILYEELDSRYVPLYVRPNSRRQFEYYQTKFNSTNRNHNTVTKSNSDTGSTKSKHIYRPSTTKSSQLEYEEESSPKSYYPTSYSSTTEIPQYVDYSLTTQNSINVETNLSPQDFRPNRPHIHRQVLRVTPIHDDSTSRTNFLNPIPTVGLVRNVEIANSDLNTKRYHDTIKHIQKPYRFENEIVENNETNSIPIISNSFPSNYSSHSVGPYPEVTESVKLAEPVAKNRYSVDRGRPYSKNPHTNQIVQTFDENIKNVEPFVSTTESFVSEVPSALTTNPKLRLETDVDDITDENYLTKYTNMEIPVITSTSSSILSSTYKVPVSSTTTSVPNVRFTPTSYYSHVTTPARVSRVNSAIKSIITTFSGARGSFQRSKCLGNETIPNVNCNEIQQRTSVRGRGSAHYTNSDEGVAVNRGTPAARSRPTLKPSTSIVSKASEFIDIYKYAPSRPAPIYPTPQVDKSAAKCRKDVCLLPDCSCGGKDVPGDLPVESVPQIVLLTFDDSVNDLNKGLYSDLFEKGRVNPNGCPISATFYVSHEWTDYSQVQNLYATGHEIASHTVSHSFGEQFSQKKWNREVAGQREILAAYGGVHLEDVRGMRAPFLSIGGNKMFKMLYDSNFTYDSSMPVYENRPPSWPYTLDYKLFHDCMIPPCPTRSYPGVWEVPMVMWQDLNGGRCSMGDACSNPPAADGVFKMLMKNFDRHYSTNRAPFGLFYHAAWFTQPHHKEGFIQFLDTINAMKDVYLVTNWQAIQWVRDPTPLSRLQQFQPFQCHYPNRPKKCNNPKVCNLWHKSGVRYMRTCQPCPDIYPWTGKTGIKSSRIDNDIDD